jgi:hypothetical protein
LNYTVDFKTALANRQVFYAEDEASYWGVPLATTHSLKLKPDGGS